MNAKLGWGLIGASTIAHTWMVGAINTQPDSQVVSIMSSSPLRAQQFARTQQIAHHCTALDDLLADPAVDVVYISTTNELHKEQALAAARAGKHVLCEKPLALTLADAKEMVAACAKAGVVMGANHHLRNAVTHRTLRKLIADGAIGQPLAARVFHAVYLPPHLQGWRINAPQAGGGVILDITVHDADTLRFVLNANVESVIAMEAQQGMAQGNLSDAVMGVMRFDNGVLAQFHDAFTIQHTGTGMQIHGTEGSLLAEDVMTQQPIGKIYLRRHAEVEEVQTDPPENLYVRSVRLFNQAVKGQGQPAATAEDGIHSLAAALAAAESARTGRSVAVEK
ncbi:MAG: Gfo/Idh/MocA family oxidoreductase [Caldilineaceae bacterium]